MEYVIRPRPVHNITYSMMGPWHGSLFDSKHLQARKLRRCPVS